MFERYTEPARRVLFHARHYALRFGSPSVEAEHLLLGLMAEDPVLLARLQKCHATADSLAKDIAAITASRANTSPSADVLLSNDSRRALAYADEESQALKHSVIDCGHIVLGLLRMDNSPAADFLRRHGIEHAVYRETVTRTLLPHGVPTATTVTRDDPVALSQDWNDENEIAASPSLAASIAALKQLVVGAMEHLDTSSDDYGEQKLKRKSWSRKEALGHLVNMAAAHHVWVARALTEPGITVGDYPREEWVFAQNYGEYSWRRLLDLWLAANQLLVHVLTCVPEEKVNTPCRIGIAAPESLLAVVRRYVDDTDDLIGQILSRL